MTKETQSMDFSGVGGSHLLAALGEVKNGLEEAEYNRYDWLHVFLWKKRLTDMYHLEQLAKLSDEETMNLLTTKFQRVMSMIGLTRPMDEVFQQQDISRLTNLLAHARKFAHDREAFEQWARRPNR
jgi:hypothetical protein